jgi:5-methylcytosine-specific restriction endonuclease McrA
MTTADAYLSHTAHGLPASFVFTGEGNLRPAVRDYVQQGVVRVSSGPEVVSVTIDIRRPYHRPRAAHPPLVSQSN